MDFKFKTEPYQHQLAQFEKHKDADYFGLFNDMGTGKSKIAIDICGYRYLKGDIEACLVIAPNNVHAQWVQEQFPMHCPVPYHATIWYSGKQGNRIWRRRLEDTLTSSERRLRVLSVNVEAFQSDAVIPTVATLVKNYKTFIIVDEATRIKNRGAKRTKIIHRLNKYGVRCVLTGTPTAQSPFDLWSMMEFLKANYFGINYFVFQHRFGVMMRGVNPYNGGRYTTLIDVKTWNIVKSKLKKTRQQRNGELMPDDYETISAIMKVSERDVKFIDQHDEYTKYKRLDELKLYIDSDVSSVRKVDCLDLPDKVYEVLPVQLSSEQRKVYDNLKTELMAEYEDKELTIVNKVSLTLRLLQVVGGFFPYVVDEDRIMPTPQGPQHYSERVGRAQLIGNKNVKLEAILADLEEVPEDQQMIVWAHFVAELKFIYEMLSKKYRCCLYYGGTFQQQRWKMVKDFQKGEYQVFVGNPATAGFGLNLQNATLQYYFSNSFHVEPRLQAEDRSHRIGVKETCVYKDVVAKNTIDEKVYSNIRVGRDMNEYFKQTTLKELLADEEVEF